MANLALLKLYQFNPSLCSPVPALRALLLPLAHNPFQADFNLCWSLLSDSFVAGAVPVPSHQPDSDDDDDEDETAAAVGRNRSFVVEKLTAERLRSLSQLLASRKFVAFWQLLRQGTATQARDDVDATEHAQEVQDAVRKLVDEAPGFEARVRQSIAGEIEQSFRGIKRATLESFLGGSLSDSSDALVQQRGWTIKGDQVQLPQNESNSPVSVVTNEKIAIDREWLSPWRWNRAASLRCVALRRRSANSSTPRFLSTCPQNCLDCSVELRHNMYSHDGKKSFLDELDGM